jgi:hypothetical protein
MPEDATPPWLDALHPFAERADYRVPLKTPIHRVGGRIVADVAGVFLRLPRREGPHFADDLGRRAAAMVELEGEPLMAELAVLRLLERAGWSGRWVNTVGAGGEVWKYLTHWAPDLPRDGQRNRVLEEEEPRQVLAAIARRAAKRYAGCWDVYAWRGGDFAFLQLKRGAPKAKDEVAAAQVDWLHTALLFGDARITPASFAVVHWEYGQV